MTDSADLVLTADEWVVLLERVFTRLPHDRRLGLLVDLPDAALEDNEDWQHRRRLAYQWRRQLLSSSPKHGLEVELLAFRNARTNNAPLPDHGWRIPPDGAPHHVDDCAAMTEIPLRKAFAQLQLILAPTELSATAPLKLAAKEFGFRAATMPGFSPAMTPALRLDYGEIDRRCRRLKELLDDAQAAEFIFSVSDRVHELTLDLRFRQAHVSSGLLHTPGTAGNLPSGETYIVPYEGERPSEPSRTRGTMPVQLGDEVVFFAIEGNRAIRVDGQGPIAREQAELLAAEPAYGNIAELGLGVLADFGLQPIGEILLDEKLGLHIAFGRSDHFGGMVSPQEFSSPEKAVHIDRVYLPETQPLIETQAVDLIMADGSHRALMGGGVYESGLFATEGDR